MHSNYRTDRSQRSESGAWAGGREHFTPHPGRHAGPSGSWAGAREYFSAASAFDRGEPDAPSAAPGRFGRRAFDAIVGARFGGRGDCGFRGRGPQGHGGFEGYEERGPGGPGRRGFGGGRQGGHPFGFGGGGRDRLFDGGDLKLVILKLIADKPSYGYELIKTMEERLAGGYAPSPGVIYPTLTLLEEEGFATVATSEAGKKVYTVTDAGRAELTANDRRLAEIFERVEHAGRGFRRGRSPEIMRAFMSLRSAVQARVSREGLTDEQIARMAEAIETAARSIDGM